MGFAPLKFRILQRKPAAAEGGFAVDDAAGEVGAGGFVLDVEVVWGVAVVRVHVPPFVRRRRGVGGGFEQHGVLVAVLPSDEVRLHAV